MLDTITPPPVRPLRDILNTIDRAAEGDQAFICAAAINLYMESSRRLYGRHIMTAGDFQQIMKVIDILLADEVQEPPKSHIEQTKLTEEMEHALLKGLEPKLDIKPGRRV